MHVIIPHFGSVFVCVGPSRYIRKYVRYGGFGGVEYCGVGYCVCGRVGRLCRGVPGAGEHRPRPDGGGGVRDRRHPPR
ncbi:hypothetical protein CH299_05080, partial [Rhodococcus sp. 14-2686-1-2]